jgi:hypothetical protein
MRVTALSASGVVLQTVTLYTASELTTRQRQPNKCSLLRLVIFVNRFSSYDSSYIQATWRSFEFLEMSSGLSSREYTFIGAPHPNDIQQTGISRRCESSVIALHTARWTAIRQGPIGLFATSSCSYSRTFKTPSHRFGNTSSLATVRANDHGLAIRNHKFNCSPSPTTWWLKSHSIQLGDECDEHESWACSTPEPTEPAPTSRWGRLFAVHSSSCRTPSRCCQAWQWPRGMACPYRL